MNRPQGRVTRSPIVSYIKPPSPSTNQSPNSSTYFDSKLFRGKSTGNSSGCLQTLRELNTLKAKHSLHALPYSELCKLISPDNELQSPRDSRPASTKHQSVVLSSLRDSYISLNPESIQDDLPKKKAKAAPPSQQRQILINQFLNQSETTRIHKPFNSLEYVWHQTLSSSERQSMSSLKTPQTGNRKILANMMKDPVFSIKVEKPKEDVLEGENRTQSRRETHKELEPPKQNGEISPMKKNEGEEGYYTSTARQMEFLVSLVKDFYKILSHTQKSYQKAKAEQTHLTEFVSTFIEELDQIEKTPKLMNMARVDMCVTSLETKVEDLTDEKDLIIEQLERIRDLIKSQDAKMHPFFLSQPRLSVMSQSIDLFSMIDSPKHMRTSSVPLNPLSLGQRNSLGNNENCESKMGSSRDISVITSLQAKTKELKIDVEKLQNERLQLLHKTPKRKTQPLMSAQSKSRKGSLHSVKPVDSPASDLSYKVSRDSSPKGQKPPADLFALNQPSQVNIEDSEEAESQREEESKPKKKMMKYHREIELKDDEEHLKKIQGNASEIGALLYGLYENILNDLEGKLKTRIEEMKVFQKDVDDVSMTDTRILKTQINSCFENLGEGFLEMNHSFDIHVRYFLEAIEQNYQRFLNLANSNLLKLTSVKNIVRVSVEKLRKLEKLTKKYTQLDLADKMIRKDYDTKFRGLKQDLQSDKKTLLFLIEQFDHSVSIYCLDALGNLRSRDARNLVEQSKMLLKVIYNMEKFPALEEEFDEKTTTAYNKCKETTVLIDSLKEFRKTNGIISSEKYRETEESLKSLENLHGRVFALQNEMTMISKLQLFQDLASKPLLIVIKLVKKLEAGQKELKELLEKIKEDLIMDYNELLHQAEVISAQIDSHIKRIGSNCEHVNFSIWNQNYQVIEGLRKEVDQLMAGVHRYVEAKYPQSIALVPSPQEKMSNLQSVQRVTDCLLKIIGTGQTFETWAATAAFSDFKSYCLREKLNRVFVKVQEEIDDKEKAVAKLGKESEAVKRLAHDVLQVLFQLRSLILNTFELEERIYHEYNDFQEDHLSKDLYLLNPSIIPETHKRKYPRLMTSLSSDRFELWDGSKKDGNSPTATVDEDHSPYTPKSPSSSWVLKPRTFKKQVTLGMVKALPALENAEGGYPNKMTGFIERMKWVFQDFYEKSLMPCIPYHKIFKDILVKFKEMGSSEVQLLEQAQRAVYNIQVNHVFYNREIRPLTNVHKYLYALNNWSDKVGNLNIIRESMKSCLDAIKVLEGEPILRGGIELQMQKYKQIQSMVSNSVNIVIDLVSLGTVLNETDMEAQLGHSLRIEDGGLEEYVRVFEKNFQALYESYKTNSDLLEEDTEKLMENLQDFLEMILGILKLAQIEYSNLFRITSDGLRPYEGNLFGYVEEIYTGMRTFADEFCDRLNMISSIAAKPTWLVKVLDTFYRDIVLKDLSVFSRLYEEGKLLAEFIDDFKEKFIEDEITKNAYYKRIDKSNPTYCDKQVEKCTQLSKGLNDFLTCEEILCRPELKNTLSLKLKEIQAIKKVYTIFAVVYSMGRKLDDNMNALIEKKNILDIYDMVLKLDTIVGDILNHLVKEIEGAKALDKDSISLSIGVSLEVILKSDVLTFYTDCSKWLGELKEYLNGISQFYIELKRRYKNQVLLLRDDWVDFVKEWVATHFVSLTKRVHLIDSDYPEFKEKLQRFLKELEALIKNSKYMFLETMKRVEYLNEYFFNEWFFNFSEEEKDLADKLLPRMKKIIRNIRIPKYKTASKLRQKLKKLSDQVEKCDKCIRELAKQNFAKNSFEGIKGWNVVAEYHGRKSIGNWKQIIDFTINELISVKDTVTQQPELKHKPETVEELYANVEQKLKCTLTEIQKDLLESIYVLPLEES